MSNTTTHSPVPHRFRGAWETKRLGSIGRCLRGVSYDPTTDLASYDKDGTVRLLRANNVQDAVVTVTDVQYVDSHRVADFQVMQPDDILICMANGSKALVGKAGLFRIQDGYTYAFGAFMGCFRVDSTLADARFVFYLLQTGEFRDYIGLVLAGSSINNLKPSDIEAAGFRLPARDEQTAIADILSDLDAAIDASDALIAKKRAVKHAAMQQLLTGETRLPGFSGEWKKTRMGRIGATYSGLSGKSKVDFGGGTARYVTFLGVLENVVVDARHTERVHVTPGESQNAVLGGDLLFNGSSETPGDLAMGAVVGEQLDNLYLNSFCFGFRVHDEHEHNPLFLAFFFRSSVGRAIMNALAQGATRYNLSKAQFLALEVSIPTYEEQRAIAAVLSDMDAEIEALERRRDKVHAIKQGMMQELLTGRVRLAKSA